MARDYTKGFAKEERGWLDRAVNRKGLSFEWPVTDKELFLFSLDDRSSGRKLEFRPKEPCQQLGTPTKPNNGGHGQR